MSRPRTVSLKVEAMADGTRTIREIAEALGVGREYVSATLGRLGKRHMVKRGVRVQGPSRADLARQERDAAVAAALGDVVERANERHVIHMTAKGRNPADYISDWSMFSDQIRALIAPAAQSALDAHTEAAVAAERARIVGIVRRQMDQLPNYDPDSEVGCADPVERGYGNMGVNIIAAIGGPK